MSAGVRWASCSREASWAASQYRHLIKPGALTTVCGASASHAEVWRGNTTKPQCKECLTAWNGEELARTVKAVTAEAPAPEPPAVDWNERYRGYAYRQLRNTRDTMTRDLARDTAAGKLSDADTDRALARLASYNDLITALESLKGLLK